MAAGALTFYFLILTSAFVGAADYRESPKVDEFGDVQQLDTINPLTGLHRPINLRLDTRLNGAQLYENFTSSLAVFRGSIQAGPDAYVSAKTGTFEVLSAANGSGIDQLDARNIDWATRAIADANVTVTAADSLVVFTSLTGARTITLPVAADSEGIGFTFKDESGAATAHPVVFAAAIEGSTAAISVNYGVVRVYARDGAWHRL